MRHRDDETRGHVDQIASKPVDVESQNAADIFAKVVAAFTAGAAHPAGERAIHGDGITGLEAGDPRADGGDLTCGFRANDQWQLSLGERHAAKAPDVDVVERERLDAHLHLVRARRRGRGNVGQRQLTLGDKGEGAH